ncbi:MAG: 5'-methylthioadenosine/S-adenosylhomocysteine nucleosidase [Rhizobiaceae bacterium]
MIDVDSVAVQEVGGVRVLYVMATQAEYLAELRKRFQPLICQVGPVEAALHVAGYLAVDKNVDLVVSLGSAGSARLEQAHVYQVSSVAYRDMDASPFGFPKGVTPFSNLPAVIDLGMAVPGLEQASISTGADIVSGEAYKSIDQDMVDMESWAVMRTCHVFGVPMIGLRGISDGAHPVAEYSDWSRYLAVIDQRLALAVDDVEAALKSGQLSPALPDL